MRVLIYSLILFAALAVSGQSSQGEYLEAKRQFSLGNYKVAMQAFQSLSDDKNFAEYASFYYALSALKMNQLKLAEDMFKQIQVKYPKWDKQPEAAYWLTYTAFQRNDFWTAFQRAEKLPEDWKDYLIDSSLSEMSIGGLDSAYTLNPDNAIIANYLIQAIKKRPYEERDQLRLIELAEKFDVTLSISAEYPLIKKEKYGVAVVLPFMFDGLQTPQTVIRNSIIFDLYQGMLLAQDELNAMGVELELFPFDTQKKGAVTYDLIKSKKLDNADVIIGPLYSGPGKYINQFSKANKINMVNPLSSNEEIVGDNPFSYLFKPSYSTQGREAAKHAIKKYSDNKKAFIFYETDRDSIVASSYLKTIEKDSFFVIRFDRLTSEDALQLQNDFTEQYEVRLDTMYTQKEIDSIALIPGRVVRTRSLRNESTGRIMRDRKGEEIIEHYEVKFTIPSDSIGHIFAATSSNLLANNLISMIEVRSDSIGMIGYKDWLDFSVVSYSQLERLQINFLNPSYYNTESYDYKELVIDFISKIGKEPSEYHIYGYELLKQIVTMLNKHGKYFQRGWIDGSYIPGYMMEGLKYGIHNDNQVVPISTLKDLQLINQNTEQEVEETNED